MSEINPNPTVVFIPQNYRGQTDDSLSDIAVLNGYPNISYASDIFNAWIAQNSSLLEINAERENLLYSQNKASQQMDVVSGILNTTLGALSSNAGGNIASGLTSLGSIGVNAISNEKSHELNVRERMAQIEAQSLVPKNVSMSGSNATLLGYGKIHENIFTRYNIKRQFAERIDRYFDLYGYQTNTLKIPNINNRPNWNYVKTLNANINGNIPQMDLAEIKELFNSGITLWHNTANFKNYAANNR